MVEERDLAPSTVLDYEQVVVGFLATLDERPLRASEGERREPVLVGGIVSHG